MSVVEPRPGDVLRALRRLRYDNTALSGAPVEEFARQLAMGGYLREKPSLALVAETLEILEAGGLGLRNPTLQPCALDFYWDDSAAQVAENIDLSFAIDWVGAPTCRETGAVPEKYTHAKSPPCTDLISSPGEVLRDNERRPGHVCGEEFMRQSTELWAQAQPFTVDDLNIYRWASMYPLPIGRRALLISSDVTDTSEWAEVLDILPFEGLEMAAWALHVRHDNGETWSALDLFGLEEQQENSLPVAGPLAHRSLGTDTSLVDVLDAAGRWWSQFRGLVLPPGRPSGTGTWTSPEQFHDAYRKARGQIRAAGEKVSDEKIAIRLNVSKKTVDRAVGKYGRPYES